jgi:hypothetical protein
MKMPFCPLAVFCVLLLAGCQTTSERSATIHLPPAGDIADFVTIEEFLRATYCPALTDFKLQIDPDYDAMANWDHAAFDQKLKADMENNLKKQGDLFVHLTLPNRSDHTDTDNNRAFFECFFDRVSGKLRVFQQDIGALPSNPLWIEFPASGVHREAVFSVFNDLDGTSYTTIKFDKGAKVFSLRSFGMILSEPVSRDSGAGSGSRRR